MANLVSLIKQASIEAINNMDPVKIVFGNVVSTEKLRINIEQKLTIEKEHLVLTSGIYNNLKIGDNVLLIRMQGGQKYVILDKVVE